MAVNKEDKAFKILMNRRATSSDKAYYEELGDNTLDISVADIKADEVSPIPAVAVADEVAQLYTLFPLTEDLSVSGSKSHQAYAPSDPKSSPDGFLRDWLGSKYGSAYTIKLFDNNDQEIYPDDPSLWLFDAPTGVLSFNGSTTSLAMPVKVTAYRYVGQKGGNLGGGIDEPYDYDAWTLDHENSATRFILASMFKEQRDLIDLLAPPKAAALTGGNLSFAGPSQFSGKLAANLQTAWYGTGIIPGQIISTLIYIPTFTLLFNQFRSGSINKVSSYGIMRGKKIDAANNENVATVDMRTGNGTGSNSFLSVTNVQPHVNFWSKADANLNISQADGYNRYVLTHTEAGTSNAYTVFYDSNAVLPTFATNPVLTITTAQPKWLSGIQLFGLNSTFNLTYSINNLFNRVYVSNGVTQVTMPGITSFTSDPQTVPNYDDVFTVTTQPITLSVANQVNNSPVLTVTARKPNNNNAASATFNVFTSLSRAINTYGNVATQTIEYLQDESLRLNKGTNTPFVSSTALVNGEAVVYNGMLTYGLAYYPGKTGTQTYERRFLKASSPSGGIKFSGISYSDISAYNLGNLNIFIKLETDNLFYDLGKAFSFDNGTGSGNSVANSKGCYVSQSGGYINFSFGTNNTADNSNIYRVIVVFRNNSALSITGMETI